MTSQAELVLVVYALSVLESVHWLSAGQVAYKRNCRGRWRFQRFSVRRFTLLKRMPVFVAPLALDLDLLIDGRGAKQSSFKAIVASRTLVKSTVHLALRVLILLQAVLLWLLLPLCVFEGYFSMLWAPIGVLVIVLHTSICCLVMLAAGRSEVRLVLGTLFNPLAVFRVMNRLTSISWPRLDGRA